LFPQLELELHGELLLLVCFCRSEEAKLSNFLVRFVVLSLISAFLSIFGNLILSVSEPDDLDLDLDVDVDLSISLVFVLRAVLRTCA
jgi:hypothetical protein